MNSELEWEGAHLRGYSNLKKNGVHQESTADPEEPPENAGQECCDWKYDFG